MKDKKGWILEAQLSRKSWQFKKKAIEMFKAMKLIFHDGELKENLVVRFFRTTENLYHEKMKKFVI